MPQPFKCPSCGGPLEYDGGEITIRCEFCSSSVIVPDELREIFRPAHGAVPLPDQLGNLAEIGRLIRAGDKISAIKLYRKTFGSGLKEAKEAVERLAEGKPLEVSQFQGYGSQTPPVQTPYASLPGARKTVRLHGCSPLAVAVIIFALIGTVVAGSAFFILFGLRSVVTDKKGATGGDGKSSSPGFAKVLLKFGSDGIGPGQFKDARTVAVDGDDRIYVADYTGKTSGQGGGFRKVV
jgi:hypothetical protein